MPSVLFCGAGNRCYGKYEVSEADPSDYCITQRARSIHTAMG